MTNGEEMDAFAAWAKEWNAMVSAPVFYKNGKKKPPRKKPVDGRGKDVSRSSARVERRHEGEGHPAVD